MAINVGFVGAGGRARAHMKALGAMDDVKIVAICDVAEETAQTVAGELGASSYTDHHAMLDGEDLDALYVSVPTFAHTDAEILAAGKGIHLFLEKPVAPSMDKALEILEAIEKAGVLSSVGYQVRYSGYVQQARAFFKDRDVGMVVSGRWGGLPPTLWWRVMAQSGGQLVEQTTHQVDLLRYVLGEVDEVHAYYAQRTMDDVPNLDIPDVYTLNMKFASGAIGSLTSTCSLREGGGGGTTDFIMKNMRAEMGRDGLKISPEGAADPGSVPDDAGDIDEVFIDAIRRGDGSKVLSDFEDGVRTLDITLAANKSAETGKPERTHFSGKP